MKTLFTLIAALALTVAAQAQSNTNVLNEITINVNSSTNINASVLRLTIQSCGFDAQTWVPIVTFNIECWADEVDNGATNRVIVAKKALTMTAAQLKALMNAPNAQAAFTASILAKAKMTAK